MIDAKVLSCAESLLNKNSKGRVLPLSTDLEEAGVCSMIFSRDLNQEQRWEIISAYLGMLEKLNAPIGIESDLPYPKEQIRFAIFQELIENPSGELSYQLEIAYMQLEIFISSDDYKTLADFKNASREAQEMEDPGDPTSVIRLAGLLKNVKGDRAVKIQETISDKMRERLLQVQEIGMAGPSVSCLIENCRQACS
jgi:hypothetical protein